MPKKATALYLDTSCAVKLFLVNEIGRDRLISFLKEQGDIQFVSSKLLKIEFDSALRQKFNAGVLTRDLLENLERDWHLQSKLFVFKNISDEIISSAQNIIKDTNVTGRVRSLDCIHFATFKQIAKIFPDIIMVSSDEILCHLAEEENLKFFNPLNL